MPRSFLRNAAATGADGLAQMERACHDFRGGGCAAVTASLPDNVLRSVPTISRSNPTLARPVADPDADLVRKAAAGDMGAFEALVEQHQRSVYGVVSRMIRDRDQVDDVVQDVFLLVLRSLDRFRGDSLFSTWLHSIAVNTALKHLKKTKRRSAASLDDPENGIADSIPAMTPDPGDEAAAAVRAEMIRREVERLPEKHRAVVVLYYFEEHSCEEIAQIVGCSVGTVWSRLHYACRKLRGRLAEIGHD